MAYGPAAEKQQVAQPRRSSIVHSRTKSTWAAFSRDLTPVRCPTPSPRRTNTCVALADCRLLGPLLMLTARLPSSSYKRLRKSLPSPMLTRKLRILARSLIAQHPELTSNRGRRFGVSDQQFEEIKRIASGYTLEGVRTVRLHN